MGLAYVSAMNMTLADLKLFSQARRFATIPGQLRSFRELQQVSVQQVQDVVGLARSTIFAIERGERQIPRTEGGLRYAKFIMDMRRWK